MQNYCKIQQDSWTVKHHCDPSTLVMGILWFFFETHRFLFPTLQKSRKLLKGAMQFLDRSEKEKNIDM